MKILKVVGGNVPQALRTVSEPVEQVTDEIAGLCFRMIHTCRANNGIGLSAPQVGDNRRIIVVWMPPAHVHVLINPEITRILSENTSIDREGCLSLPGVEVRVQRHRKIMVSYTEVDGSRRHLRAHGILARVIQHEIDHLNGKLITDYLPVS